MRLASVGIRHAALSNRIVLARFGKDANLALETKDAMDEFWKCLVSYSFNGMMPEKGKAVEIRFGGGDEQFTVTVKRDFE